MQSLTVDDITSYMLSSKHCSKRFSIICHYPETMLLLTNTIVEYYGNVD